MFIRASDRPFSIDRSNGGVIAAITRAIGRAATRGSRSSTRTSRAAARGGRVIARIQIARACEPAHHGSGAIAVDRARPSPRHTRERGFTRIPAERTEAHIDRA
jgi:hypothetical protein